MQPPYEAALREAVRLGMSPPSREILAEIARETGIGRVPLGGVNPEARLP